MVECRECRFYKEDDPSPTDGVGECRRHAPRPMFVGLPVPDPGAVWPFVCGDEWCGEFESKESEAHEHAHESIDVLFLSVRARRALEVLDVKTLGDLASKTRGDLRMVPGCGATTVMEIRRKLFSRGLCLRGLDAPPNTHGLV